MALRQKQQPRPRNLRESVRQFGRSLGDTLVRWGVATPSPPPPGRTLIEREYTHDLREAADVPIGGLASDYGFRRLSAGERDLSPVTQDKMLKMVHYLWTSNPIAHRSVEILRDLILAEGFSPSAKSKNPEYNERIQKVLDTFWNDPVNAWDMKLPERVLELILFGEQPWRAFVELQERKEIDEFGNERAYTIGRGRVRLGLILPENILHVHANPLNGEDLTHIELKTPIEVRMSDGSVEKREFFEIVRIDTRHDSPTYGQLIGEVFFFALNRMGGATRGISELYAAADWIDMLDNVIYSETERIQLIKNYVWDVTLKGKDEPAIRAWMQANRKPPKAGSIRAHNEGETWQALVPDMKSTDTVEYIKFLMGWCLGSMGIPEVYFFEGKNTNKASASEQTAPVFARVRSKQKQIKDMIEFMLAFVVFQAKKAGVLADIPNEEMGVQVVARDPERKGYETAGDALTKLGQALANAVMAGWVTDEEAATCFRAGAGALGVQLEDDNNSALLTEIPTQKKPSQAVLQDIGGSGGKASGGSDGGAAHAAA